MKLKRVTLKGFMRFKGSFEIEFPQNQVTLIAGENGAGKTSILDAICICLYGKTFRTSGRTTSGYLRINDLINHESPKATIRLEFENHGHNYVVAREITKHNSDGALFEDGESKAVGQRVYDYVRRRAIGLDWEGFRKSTIVLQGEISSLTEMDPGKRKDAFVKLFGLNKYLDYDRLAQEKAGSKESGVKEIEAANKILSADIQQIPEIREEIRRLKESVDLLERKKLRLAKIVERRKKEKDALEGDHNRYVVLKERRKGVIGQISDAIKTLSEKRRELKRLLKLQEEFPRLEKSYDELSSLDSRIAGLKPTKAKYDKYGKEISAQRATLNSKRENLASTLGGIKKTKMEISSLKKQIPPAKTLSTARESLKKAQDRESRLQEQKAGLKAEIKQIKGSIKNLKTKMEQVKDRDKCPVCLQKIIDPSQVLKHYSGEIKKLISKKVAKEKKFGSVERELQTVSKKVKHLTETKVALEKQVAKEGELTRERDRLLDLGKGKASLRAEIDELKDEIKKLLGEQMKLGFIPTEYNRLERRTTTLRKNRIAEKFTNSKTELNRLPDVEQDLTESQERLGSLGTQRSNLVKEAKKFGRIEVRYKRAKTCFEQAQKSLTDNEVLLAAEQSEKKQSQDRLNELKDKEAILKENSKKIQVLNEERTTLEELRSIFKSIPENILRRLRPFIEKEGTDIINDLSNSEITALNIEEETLNVAATMNGEVRPIHYFSGGQKTRINMALRVAISRMLSKLPQTEEHTFAIMQTLFIDEGDFGDLDEAGIREAIGVIRNLTKEFDRVILISHVDAIREIFHGFTIEILKTGMIESVVKTFLEKETQVEMPRITT